MNTQTRSLSHRRRIWGASYADRVLSTAPIAYWPLDEKAGTGARCPVDSNLDGTYAAAGIAYAADEDGPFGTAAPTFDGSNTYVSFGNASFAAAWDGDLFSMISWGRVDGSARWTDSATYRYLQHIRSSADSTYYAVMGKNTTNHQLEWRRRSGGAIVSQTYTFSPSGPLDWFCMGMTHDQSVPVLNYYLWDSVNGFQTLTPSNSASLTAWGANPPDQAGTTVMMAGSITAQEWIGAGAQHIVWDRMLSTATMQALMTP